MCKGIYAVLRGTRVLLPSLLREIVALGAHHLRALVLPEWQNDTEGGSREGLDVRYNKRFITN